MHISGKILAWFVVIGALAAIFMSAKALAIRNAWMEKAQKAEAEFIANEKQIAEKTTLRDNKRAELARTMLGWDRYWQDVPVNINPQTGAMGIQMGTDRGLQADQVIFVFIPQPDGKSVYAGDYKITRIAAAGAEARPNWRVRAGDIKAANGPVRIRSLIPNQYQTRFGWLGQQLLTAETSVATNQSELARQMQLLTTTDTLIAKRLNEINGDAAQEGKEIPEVYIKGLLTGIVDEEETRSAALREADRLLHELKHTKDEFERIRALNQQLVDSLPQPVAASDARAGR